MKYLVTYIVLSLVWTVSAQPKYTYYTTGRPDNIERNNAIITVGKSWDIDFKYAGNDVLEMKGLEAIQIHNDSVSVLIGKKTNLGAEWQTYFFSSVDKEQTIQELIRGEIKETESYKLKSNELFESFLLMTRKKKCIGKFNYKYTIYTVGQLKVDEQRIFQTVAKYGYGTAKKKLKPLKLSNNDLPFSLPQNGIN